MKNVFTRKKKDPFMTQDWIIEQRNINYII